MPAHYSNDSAINLAPMERVISIAGGALLIRKGLAIGGVFGLTDIAAGALGILRRDRHLPGQEAHGSPRQGRHAQAPAAAAAPAGLRAAAQR